MTGGYLFKMWGLPAAAFAIWHAARKENRAKVGGIMVSAALTAFLTGITEPIEFAFLFVAPLLYAIHALLAGVAYFVCIALHIKHGFTFSHGLIDYVVLFPKSQRALWLFAIGPIWAAVYYGIFSFAIRKFNLMFRSSCSQRTRNDSTAPAAGGARFSLLQDSRHNSTEQSSRKQRLWITKPFNNQRPHNLIPGCNSPLSALFLRTNARASPGCERRSH